MSVTQLLQAMPAKANALFAKLVDTSDGAVKTRERLLAELRDELEQQARLEERHLFPVLRRHAETKGFVAAAAETNKEVRRLLDELSAMPKDGAAFADKAGELRALFQRHIRDDKKELLPAVRKALSEDEQQALAATLEAGKDAIRKGVKAGAEDGAGPGEAAEAVQGAAETAKRTVEAGKRTVEAGAAAARSTVRSAAESALKTAGTIDRMAGPARERALALSTAPNVAARAASEAGAAWIAYLNRTASAGSTVAQRLTRCTTPRDVTDLQGEVLGEAVDAWFDMQNRLLDISMRASRDMVRPAER
ncbi:hemerythrin domain-containing protein [Azospirillum sp. A39]|uniref:hemerythrin domain-containing protein n=1 Tax=Azospirillum sp. A39 TaxID=3462279 RepID=UPI0040458D3E